MCLTTVFSKRFKCSIFVIICLIVSPQLTAQIGLTSEVKYSEVVKEFPASEKNLRKWGTPVIADLDGDGYLDVLLNEHGFAIQVMWNNKGRLAKPFDIIMGDLHGLSVGDIDNDGFQEVIMSRGGGSGSNARNSKIFKVQNREFVAMPDFDPPLALMRGRTVKFIDGDNDGDLDLLNFAFPDGSKKGESENYVYENIDGILMLKSMLPASRGDGQKTLVCDFNNDDVFDIILYGQGNVKAFEGKGDLTYEEVTSKVFPHDLTDVTGITEIDYDNDGDFDLYYTRGNEFEVGETFFDKERNIWGYFTKRGTFQFEDLEIGDVLIAENLQSQWPHKSLFLGETGYEFEYPGETHSGRDLRLVNSDALGFPDSIDKKGTFVGYVGNKKWRLAGDIWAPSTGVFHGVKNYPKYNHREGLEDILLENKNGRFVDVSHKANVAFKDHTVSVVSTDLDNNGYQDLVVKRRGELIFENELIILLNQKDGTFKKAENHKAKSNDLGAVGMALEIFDYNNDGQVDILIGNERGKWHLFKNEGRSGNNYLTVVVGNSPNQKASNQGAFVTLQACGESQTKRVGQTGSPYSLGLNNRIHFGIGKCSKQLKVEVVWSNKESKNIKIAQSKDEIFIGSKLK